jgi:hypothetical protein
MKPLTCARMTPLPKLLRRVLEELTHEQGGPCPVESGAPDGEHLERWEDEDYIYLEADLAEDLGPAIDICIYKGRAFIRMTRISPDRRRTCDDVMGDGR